jgi:hypothetical protein
MNNNLGQLKNILGFPSVKSDHFNLVHDAYTSERNI